MTKRYLTVSNATFLELVHQLLPNERRNEDDHGMNLIVYVQTNGDGALGQLVLVPTVPEALVEHVRLMDQRREGAL